MKALILRVERKGGAGNGSVVKLACLGRNFHFFFTSAEVGDEYGAVDLEHADGEKEIENGTGAGGVCVHTCF